ncbi:hypothetical protein A3H53_03845 [Candidatus Nomurabacteria bacterium RIFCSPLOWO2_02_FULL_40_10]|uniref:Uncharacterized protein n=2 Tax=Candidatus Nomuraibacteriota TaxID=1752729 RepID=A0A1F6XVT3_9BACT|nr:MAG: hypothetical protein A2642_01305 [Candidatus Nomurabacteria bacterium RIFCSPHIGHO2_01_FULL_39_10]OGI98245.1 MAG: hypothetical protein A3H53_03845 [Candidatus Nomurabacteria bacterium RIFCSPLOWO2_02_FULL_40_10]
MENENKTKKEIDLKSLMNIVIVAALIVGASLYTARLSKNQKLWHPARLSPGQQKEISLQDWVELPVVWGDLGLQMTEAGVIDKEKFEALYASRGGLSEADKKLLYDADNGNLVINTENSGIALNMLWAFGLANKNPILSEGPMMDPQYGGAGNFASTGGWTLARGNAMSHYSMHSFVTLTGEQQSIVERVAKNIYRPCCDNSTYFPDCNHGMAMLGLLELMASQGVSESNMYKFALQFNALWFPDTYEAIKTFFASKNMDWNTADPKKILGAEYSSASGYQKMLSQMKPQEQKGGASCGA